MPVPSAGSGPLVIAHRGASKHAPENTMAAFEAAWSAGAAWVEADTQPSVDGVPMVLHDDVLDRTTAGRGPIREARALDVGGLDAGSWFGPDFSDARVPELDALVASLRGPATSAGDRRLLLEIKGEHTLDQLIAVMDVLRAHGVDDRVFLESFELDVLLELRKAVPGRPFGLLVERLDDDPVAAARAIGAAAYNPPVDALLARPAVLTDLHAAGLAVAVWTADDPGQWAALTDLGVDAIITNTPAELLAWQRAGAAGSRTESPLPQQL